MTRPILYTLGALCAGGGVLTAVLGGFSVPGGPASQVYSKLGYDAVADIALTDSGMIAVALFVCGIGMFIAANATAWKETGGY